MIELIFDRVTYWDVRFFSTIFGLNVRKLFKRSMRLLSCSGDGYLYLIMAAFIHVFSREMFPGFIKSAVIAFGLELTLYKIIKKRVRRPRPFETLAGIQNSIVPSDTFSFPSGHTAAAFVMAALLAYWFPVLSIFIFVWATLVGFSRVYLGVHYPSDILAGMVLGTSSALAGIMIL